MTSASQTQSSTVTSPGPSADLRANYNAHLERQQQLYTQAAAAAGRSSVVIAAGSLKYEFLDDRPYPFAVNPHFKAWLPVTQIPDCFVVIRPGEMPQLLINQPEDYWHQTPADPTGFWVDSWRIDSIQSFDDARNLIGSPDTALFIGEETQLAKTWGISAINTDSAMSLLHYERAYKSDYEIGCLQRANDLAVLGHKAAEAAFRDGLSEFEVAHCYLGAVSHREQQMPYSAIVAQNEHCAVLHNQFYATARIPGPQLHSLLIDAGAGENGYVADITRTYASRPGPFQDLITQMDQLHLGIINEIQVGLNYGDLHHAMHLRLAQILKDSGLVDLSVDAMIDSHLTFNFCPHGLGHYLGLQTHDVGGFQLSRAGGEKPAPERYPALRLTRDIEERQVFTIEPGLYFIPLLLEKLRASKQSRHVNWDLVDELSPCGGIRIEDNIAIVDGQALNLTRRAFAISP